MTEENTDTGVPPARAGDKVLKWLTTPLDGFAAFILIAMVILTCADVFGREVLNAPVSATTEITQVMMPFIIFAVMPAVCLREDHIAVDLIDIWSPKQSIGPRQIALNIILTVTMIGVGYKLWQDGNYLNLQDDRTQYLGIPKGPIAFFISVMCWMAALAFAFNVYRYLVGRGPMQDQVGSAPKRIKSA
jgi:TRAP-type C4-dicarboxylate transport system permease small subunit